GTSPLGGWASGNWRTTCSCSSTGRWPEPLGVDEGGVGGRRRDGPRDGGRAGSGGRSRGGSAGVGGHLDRGRAERRRRLPPLRDRALPGRPAGRPPGRARVGRARVGGGCRGDRRAGAGVPPVVAGP